MLGAVAEVEERKPAPSSRHRLTDVTSADLWSRYNDAETTHANLFAEQRSNLLLVAGNHYANKGAKFAQRLKELESISKAQKIRLTMNHIQRITKTYVNNILTYAPAVGVSPKNEGEVSDVKVAEMHQSVWLDMRERHQFKKLTRKWAKDLIEIGEAIAKVFFDERAGHFLGYDPLYDEITGQVVYDEQGNPVYNESPVFTGDVVFERVLGFNLLTDPTARSWEECQWVIYRKMVPVSTLKAMFTEEDVQSLITESAESTYKIFDSATGNYRDTEGLAMVMEHYVRPCADFPQGWYYYAVQGGVLAEGELPLGLFPIVYCGFDEASTSARSFSIIKQLRPYQAEVNRAASKIAEHQITLGDDKVILSNGASMTPGGTAHGLKAVHVTGSDPKIFSGRSGEQYVSWMTAQISGMYQASCVEEDSREKESGQLDPFAILYKTAKQKKPFMIYIDKFEEFLIDICKLALRYAKAFYSDEMLVQIVGKKEYMNIEEFKLSDDLGYQIKLEGVSEDLESKMGKQLVLNHLVQFAGQKLSNTDLGKMARAMPWLNKETIFEDMTQNYDNWVNDRLAMDRGKMVPAREGEDHPYVLGKVRTRMKERDFDLLDPRIQQQWKIKEQQHIQAIAMELQAKQNATHGFIPSGGFLATVEMYVPDPKDPTKQMRLRLPTESIEWVRKRLEEQGTTQEALASFDQMTQNRIAQSMGSVPQQMPVNQPVPMAV